METVFVTIFEFCTAIVILALTGLVLIWCYQAAQWLLSGGVWKGDI